LGEIDLSLEQLSNLAHVAHVEGNLALQLGPVDLLLQGLHRRGNLRR
jgi:hypothetical protein